MISFAGTVVFGQFTAAPVGWLMMTGQTITAAEFPNLAAATGRSGSWSLPNFTQRFPLASTSAIGFEGGNTNITLTTANLPSHGHGFTGASHGHSFTGGSHGHGFTGGSHGHGFTGGSHGHFINNGSNVVRTGGSGAGLSFSGAAGQSATISAANTSTGGSVGNATTGGSVGNATTGGSVGNTTVDGTVSNTGSGSAFNITPAYVVCLAIIKT